MRTLVTFFMLGLLGSSSLQAANPSAAECAPGVLSMAGATSPVEEPPSFVGEAPAMARLAAEITQVAPYSRPVLIRGESGTGKELVAAWLHHHSGRKGLMVAFNTASVPESLLESELFGHEKGAFTGADRQHKGVFERADGTTLFLDEVGEMSLEMQAKLLRVLEGKPFTRVGGKDTIQPKPRVIFATHRNLEELVREGKFREDLYYRITPITVRIPPLRERTEDIPLLAAYFLKSYQESDPRTGIAQEISEGALAKLKSASWPGNVRQLEGALWRAYVVCQTPSIEAADIVIPDPIFEPVATRAVVDPNQLPEGAVEIMGNIFIPANELPVNGLHYLEQVVQGVEGAVIARGLRQFSGNQTKLSLSVGITRGSLRNKIKENGITIEASIGEAPRKGQKEHSDD